jgi:hypothetical protein
MRVDREALLRITGETVEERVRTDRSIVAVFLCGSLLEEKYLIGGTTDIDLGFIHYSSVEPKREILPLTDEIHFDIIHFSQGDYGQPREVRIDPWLGPTVKEASILHDPQHILDFVQAGVRGQYDRPDHVHARVCRLYETARKTWMDLQISQTSSGIAASAKFVRALENAANAVASLSGSPLTDRKLMLLFPGRAESLARPGLVPGFHGLLGVNNLDLNQIDALIDEWKKAFASLPSQVKKPQIAPTRQKYYLNAIESMCAGGEKAAALWPLIKTWLMLAKELDESSPERIRLLEVLKIMGLAGDQFREKIAGLDAYLDTIETTLDEWAEARGA